MRVRVDSLSQILAIQETELSKVCRICLSVCVNMCIHVYMHLSVYACDNYSCECVHVHVCLCFFVHCLSCSHMHYSTWHYTFVCTCCMVTSLQHGLINAGKPLSFDSTQLQTLLSRWRQKVFELLVKLKNSDREQHQIRTACQLQVQ